MEALILSALLGNAVAWCFDPIQDLKLLVDWERGNWLERKLHKLTSCPSCLSWWLCFPIGYFLGEGWMTLPLAVAAHTLAALIGKMK